VNVVAGTAAKLTVSPKTPSITTDQTQQFTASVEDKYGNKLNATATWSSSGGSISQTGLFTPSTVGTFTITGSSGSVSDTATITVTAGILSKMTIEPSFKTITADETAQFTAKGTDAKGNSVPVSPAWSATGGSVSGTGLYTPSSLGTFTITASQNGVSATAQVTVKPGALSMISIDPSSATITVEQTLQFTAKGFDAKGNDISLKPTWDADIGSVSQSGLYTPGFLGNCKVTASQGSISATADVTVTPGKLKKVVMTPNNATLKVGDSVAFAVKGFDSKGNELTATSIAWSVSTDVGSVTQDGVFTAAKAGKGKVIVQVSTPNDTLSAQADIVVKEQSFTDTIVKVFGGETNFWLFMTLIIVLVVVLIVALVFIKRKRRWQEDYERAIYDSSPPMMMDYQSMPPPGAPPPMADQQPQYPPGYQPPPPAPPY
jgi:uncharacterized cupredoxin-like copper-binding protein